MRKIALFLVLATITTQTPAAEFRASYGDWRYDLSGTVTDRGRTYDLREDFGAEPRGRRTWALEWDTPKGPWPDVAVGFTQIGAAGAQERSFTVFDLLGQPVGTETASLAATADFDDVEATLRYPFKLGTARAALGVSVKKIKGELVIEDSTASPPTSRQSYDETVPEVHAQLRVPFGKILALSTSAQGISAGGNRALEWKAMLEVRWLAPLLLEAGWQEKRYELNLDGRALDARFDGALLRAGWLWR
ncbi:MAG TPA: hypothetical protein VM240_02210 [Verrucomicrobiae bacterium]|nr:hypothetical protein [Verrucomicrobiae bacterium]